MGEPGHVSQVNLRLIGAGKRFERGWIFRNLNFCGQEGERWAITGPNGSGKSTLLLSLGGYLELTEGGLSLTHANRTRPDGQVSRFTALAAPYLDLPPALTVAELLQFHRQLKGIRSGWEEPKQLDLSGLKGHFHKKTAQLSSGLRQRLRLYLAFGCAAPLLLLDEPGSHLDSHGFEWYLSLLAQPFLAELLLVVASNDPAEYAGMSVLSDLAVIEPENG